MRISRSTDPEDVVKRIISCLSWLLCTHTTHRGQRTTSHFPEALLLFLFLCDGITVKKEKWVITTSWVFLSVHLLEIHLHVTLVKTQKIYFYILLISSSNTWVRDSHFCTTYRARGVRTTGQILEDLWLCVRSQKMLCRNLTTIISSLSIYTEICRWYHMSVNLLLLHKILEAAVFSTHHCYVYPTSGVNYIIFQLQNQSISHSQISLHHTACALPWHLKNPTVHITQG